MSQSNEKIILDLCGGTGSWSRYYREAGYKVYMITLPEYDVTKAHLGATNIVFYGHDNAPDLIIPTKKIHGILAAPPCTEFSRALSSRPRDLAKGMQTVEACMKIIWGVKSYGNLKWWALENPMGKLRQFLGKPALSFEPWWYGSFHTKWTDLWGYFEEPRRIWKVKPIFVPTTKHNKNQKHYASPKAPAEYRHLKLKRADIRAITPKEFALAFFRANP